MVDSYAQKDMKLGMLQQMTFWNIFLLFFQKIGFDILFWRRWPSWVDILLNLNSASYFL